MDIKDIIAKAGGAVALARALGIKHSSVCEWRHVPAKRVPAVAAITELPRHAIRSDLYECSVAAATHETASKLRSATDGGAS